MALLGLHGLLISFSTLIKNFLGTDYGFMMGNKSFIFRFDDAEVREQEFLLIKAGKMLPVEPKAFRALLFLLRHPQKLISKEELVHSVWGDTAVADGSLTRCIWLLRRLLGDDINQPRYIETVATVGYRFVCKVEVSEDSLNELEEPVKTIVLSEGNFVETPANEEITTTATKPPAQIDHAAGKKERSGKQTDGKRSRFRRWLLASAAVLALALAVAAWYLHSPLSPLRVTEYTRITNDGRQKELAGTDGSRLYFNQFSKGIAEVGISGGDIARVPVAIPQPYIVDVSSDGSALFVASDDGGQGSLWSVLVPGGSTRRLMTGVWCPSASSSPNGNSVVLSSIDGKLFIMGIDGTDVHRLTVAEDHVRIAPAHFLTWSPDGRLIRFNRWWKLWEMSPNGSGLHQLLPDWHPSSLQCCGSWTPDGRFFLFLSRGEKASSNNSFSNGSEIWQIWALDERRGLFRREHPVPVQLTSGPIDWGRSGRLIPSKDRKKIFAIGTIARGELVHFDAKSKQLQPYLGGISAESVTFSPDGQFMVYVTFPEGILWRANRDGSNPIQLTSPPTYPINPRWSPDGAQLLFFEPSDSEGHTHSYVISSQGGSPRPLLPESMEHQGDPNWSPDGHRIVFDAEESQKGTPTKVIKVLDLASHQATTLPGSQGIVSPRWSPNGRFIAGLSAEDHLTIFDFDTQRWSVLESWGGDYPTWSRDGQFIYFARKGNGAGVFRIRASGGTPERMLDLTGFRFTGAVGIWFGLDPQDTPLLMRDVGTEDIYALSLEQK